MFSIHQIVPGVRQIDGERPVWDGLYRVMSHKVHNDMYDG